MADTWFRVYNSVRHNRKISRLSDAHFRSWIMLLSVASEEGGRIPGDITDLAHELRVSHGKARDVLQVLISASLIERSGDDYLPHNWSAKQFKNDSSTDRVKRFRERQTKPDETVPCNGPIVQRADTDTEERLSETGVSDAPSPPKSKRRQPYTPKFEEFWRAYPTDPNMAKLKAFEQWKRLSPEEHEAAIKAVPAFRRYCDDNAKTGYRPVHAERFLSQHRFDGFLSATASNGAGVGDPELARLQEAAARRREEKARVSTTN
jgi:hypothetical protein